jgi:hypothetical protein
MVENMLWVIGDQPQMSESCLVQGKKPGSMDLEIILLVAAIYRTSHEICQPNVSLNLRIIVYFKIIVLSL